MFKNAADVVIPRLNRLLRIDPPLVLHDRDGSAAFRYLLDTFVAAGSERAQSLWYGFADIIQ